MSDSQEIDRFNGSVTLLKQDIENVETYLKEASAPALLQLRSIEDISQSAREKIEKKLWRIFIHGEYPLATMWSNFDEPLLTNSSWQFIYYSDTYKPISEKIRELIDVSMAPERKAVEAAVVEESDLCPYMTPGKTSAIAINAYMDEYEYLVIEDWVDNFVRKHIEKCSADDNTDRSFHAPKNPIQDCFESALGIVLRGQSEICMRGPRNVKCFRGEETYEIESPAEREICDIDLSDFGKIIKKRYFRPDDWIINEEDLRPILIARKISDIRPPIRQRIREIYDSYVFGNWIAVIALSRCLLEYVLNDVGPSHGIRVHLTVDEASQKNRSKNKEWSRDLREVIDEASNTFPTLAHSMETIKLAGNKVMHPPATQKGVFADLAKWRTQNKEDARECLTHIIKITTTLYSKGPPKKANLPLKPSPK